MNEEHRRIAVAAAGLAGLYVGSRVLKRLKEPKSAKMTKDDQRIKKEKERKAQEDRERIKLERNASGVYWQQKGMGIR